MPQKQKPSFNKKILLSLPQPLIGVDEVGRGCLAGPVCAGVVILDESKPFEHYVDSKTLSEEKREALADDICANHMFALGWASVEEIDQVNIRQATFLAMKRALENLYKKYPKFKTASVVIDGRDTLPNLGLVKQLAIIKGDQHVRCISAASIVAKVARDRLMTEMAIQHPDYGFEKHKGYGTEYHRNAIAKVGITNHHRKTFGGVKEYI